MVSKSSSRDRDRDGSSFKYRPPPKDYVKKQAERRTGRFDSIIKGNFDSWRPKEGDNTIRILPAAWDGFEDYAYTVYVHAYVGPDEGTYLCPRKMRGQDCPICDEVALLKKGGETDDAKKLDWKEQKVAWIVDRGERGKAKPYLWTISAPLYRDLNALCVNSKTGATIFVDNPDEGYDVIIRRTGTRLNTRYLPQVEREASPISDDSGEQKELLAWVQNNPVPECLQFYDANYLEGVISGKVEPKDDELDDKDEERPRASKKKDEDDESEIKAGPEDDEELDERPRAKSRSRDEDEDERPRTSRKRDEDDEDRPRSKKSRDEDEDDPDERPRTSRGRRDEEDEPPRSKKSRSRDEDMDDPIDDIGRGKRNGRNGQEEENERPRAKSRSRDEDEDERPKASRKRDEDDEDRRPRRATRD